MQPQIPLLRVGGDFPALDGAWRALQDSPRRSTERDSSSKSSFGVDGVCEFVESPPSMEDEEHRTPPARMLSAVLTPGKSQSRSGHPPPQRSAFLGAAHLQQYHPPLQPFDPERLFRT